MVNYLIILFAITLVYISIAERFRIYAGLISLQGLLLFGIALIELKEVNTANMLFIALETLVFKAIVFPYLLFRIIRRTGVYKVHHKATPGFYSLIFTMISLLISIFLAQALVNPYIHTVYLTIALFTLFSGLLLIVTRKLILSHLIGFLIIENSVFMFSLAVGNEMPMLINIGILLDVFVGVLVLGFFSLRLKPHTGELNRLKD
jgi:hydrogenase-4 component E